MRRAYDLRGFVRRNAVPLVSVLAALATCAFVPPDAGYASYVDWGTLGRLACMLLAVSGLRASGVFPALAARFVARCRGVRAIVGALVGVTALASMFVTNDMALLALLPLAAACLLAAGRRDLIGVTFALQGVAANLCGMLLPFGNPQNIYLTGAFGLGFAEFVSVMLPPFAISVALVVLGCLVLVPRGRTAATPPAQLVDRRRAVAYGVLLALCVVTVLGLVSVPVCLAAVLVVTLAAERGPGLIVRTDWGLIVTFAAFFVFSGNLARVDVVRQAFSGWLAAGAFVPAAVLSQLISNVPAAVVLARFTGDWPGLLAGVNVGGAGTPIASLATLIVITQFGMLTRELGVGADAPSPEVAPPLPFPSMGSTAPADDTSSPRLFLATGDTALSCSPSPSPEAAPPRPLPPDDAAPSRSLPPMCRFLGMLCGLNAACLVILLVAGVLLGW